MIQFLTSLFQIWKPRPEKLSFPAYRDSEWLSWSLKSSILAPESVLRKWWISALKGKKTQGDLGELGVGAPLNRVVGETSLEL